MPSTTHQEGNEHAEAGGHYYKKAHTLREGDGVYLGARNERNHPASHVVRAVRHTPEETTITAEPRAGFVGREVVSRLQFGSPGITTEDQGVTRHTFHPEQLVPVRA